MMRRRLGHSAVKALRGRRRRFYDWNMKQMTNKLQVKSHAEKKLHIMLYAGRPVEKEWSWGTWPQVCNELKEEIVQANKDYREENSSEHAPSI